MVVGAAGFYVLFALALVGTTITPYMQFYIQASVVDKGIDREQYRFARIDEIARDRDTAEEVPAQAVAGQTLK